jgi:two-component system, OmpR family, sensor histidine kinase KdpD
MADVPSIRDRRAAPASRRVRLVDLVATLGAVGASTGLAWTLFGRRSLPDVVMVFVLGVVVVATRFSFAAAILTAILSVLSYDFFFIPPYYTLAVDDGRHVITFGVMFVVAVVISTLTQRTREQAAAQLAGALERARVAREAEAARIEVETERLRSSLLSSVSHDLRTPLAVITGAATTLLDASAAVDPAAQRDLLSAIYDESVRLTRLVGNLLDMTRLTAGTLEVRKEWQPIEAVVGAALGRVESRLGERPLRVQVPADLLVPFDAVLVEQVLINLLENAAKYSPPGSPVEVSAFASGPGEVAVEIADRGPGVPEPERERIFEKFHRLPGAPAGGAGLGLAICRGMVEAHGGRIAVLARDGGGAIFRFTLPVEGAAPAVEEDGAAS